MTFLCILWSLLCGIAVVQIIYYGKKGEKALMKLNQLYNKELREKLLKEDLDDFLKKYSDFMDKQVESLISIKHFTDAQQLIICSIIDDWFLEWSQKIIVNEQVGQVHRLGYAKEQLKTRLCGVKSKIELEDVTIKENELTQLFKDFQTIHSYLHSVTKEGIEVEMRDILLEKATNLYCKWADVMFRKAAKDTMTSLDEDNDNGK